MSIEGRDPFEILDGLSKTGSDWELVFENDPPELANAWGYADIICRISSAEQCGKTIITDNVPVCGDEITDTLVAFIVAHSNHLPEVITDKFPLFWHKYQYLNDVSRQNSIYLYHTLPLHTLRWFFFIFSLQNKLRLKQLAQDLLIKRVIERTYFFIYTRTMYGHLHRLLTISRPRFWIYEIGPYIIGIAAVAGLNLPSWTLVPMLLFFIFFTFPANIYIYGINDIFDYETDRLNPKKVAYESLVSPEEWPRIWRTIFLCCLPFLIYAFFVLDTLSLGTFLLFFFFAGFYSAPPIRAKARPVLDSIFSAGHYIATSVFSYLMASHLLHHSISWPVLATCTLAGMFWAIAMHAYSAVPDIQADTDARLETIATKCGRTNTILFCALLYALSGILVFQYLGMISIILALVYVVFMLKSIRTTEGQLFRIYTYFPKINSLVGMLIFFAVLFN